jgi:hypothetical protein
LREIDVLVGRSRLKTKSRVRAVREAYGSTSNFIREFSADFRNPTIFGKQRFPRKVEQIYNNLRLMNTRPAQGFPRKWNAVCAQCGEPSGPRHLLYECLAHAEARAKMRAGFESDMQQRVEENKVVRDVQKKEVIPWGSNAILQEVPSRVADFIGAIIPTLGLFDHVAV